MNTLEFPDSQKVEEQAASWIAMIDRGLSNVEEFELEDWLDISPLHGELLIKCASMWDLLDLLSPIAKLMPIIEDERKLDDTDVTRNKSLEELSTTADATILSQDRFNRFLGSRRNIAACFVLVTLLVGLALKILPNDNEDLLRASNTVSIESNLKPRPAYKTAVGEISNVSLADGSNLKLNTNSEVRVSFTDQQRIIDLLRGEVFFDVAKDHSRPFVVNTRAEQVTAVGTAFSVDLSHSSTTEVLVTHGKVRVGHIVLSSPSPYPELFLTPGQKVIIRDNQPEVSIDNDAENQLAWREGMLVFEGETLAQAISEIDRYTPLSFRISDPEIATISVGGYFKAGDLDQLLLILGQNFGVKSSRYGNEIVLSKAPSKPN